MAQQEVKKRVMDQVLQYRVGREASHLTQAKEVKDASAKAARFYPS